MTAEVVPVETQSVPLNDLVRAYNRQRGRIECATTRVLRSGWYVHGPEHEAFERELSEFVGVQCLGVASGTDALTLALLAVTERRSGPVLTAANAGGYATTAIYRCGLRPRFADVDAHTLVLSPESIAPHLSPDLAAVVVTHLYGRMAEVEEITELCAAIGVPVIEDCAQAIGARRDGSVGSVGDAAAFSFYPTKNLGALGDGGAVGTRHEGVAERITRLRQYGWTRKYSIQERHGFNSRLDELQAAILRVRLPDLDTENKIRRNVVARYEAASFGGPLEVLPAQGGDHVAHLAVARVRDGSRDALRERLRGHGVQTDVHFPVPDHRQPAWAHDHQGVHLPTTEAACDDVVTLPCFPDLTEAEIERVTDSLAALR